MNPLMIHDIEKARINLLNCPRSQSSKRSRNPILDGEAPVNQKPQKASVPSYLSEFKKYAERPRGIGLGLNPNHNQFNIGSDSPMRYKPIKKHPQLEVKTQQAAPSKRILRPQTPGRNPLLQDASFESMKPLCKKHVPPSRSENDPAVAIVASGRQDSYCKRNSSNVFAVSGTRDGFKTNKKVFQEVEPSAGAILQYKYALPYREVKVTHKLV